MENYADDSIKEEEVRDNEESQSPRWECVNPVCYSDALVAITSR